MIKYVIYEVPHDPLGFAFTIRRPRGLRGWLGLRDYLVTLCATCAGDADPDGRGIGRCFKCGLRVHYDCMRHHITRLMIDSGCPGCMEWD